MLNRLLRCSIFLVGTSLLAQDIQTVLFGQKWLNGHGWLLMSDSKATYVTALEEGFLLVTANWVTTRTLQPTADEFLRQEWIYKSNGAFTIEDYVDQIDKFYRLEANREIPVAYAYLFVTGKLNGASVKELEETPFD